MNDRSTILKIIRHPLIKQLVENKMATSSVITKLIAEELTLNEAFSKPQEIIDALKVLQASSGETPEVAAFLEKIKTGEFDKKLYRAAAMKSHPDRGGDEETFKAISGFSGIDQNLLKQTIQQAGGGQASPQQGQGEAASEEVLASVKQVIEKYQKGYESFVQMIADLKQDPALYYTDEKIQQIYKNLGALQEEVDLNKLKDPDPKKSFEKAAKALEVVKNKILQLIKSKLSDSKKQQVQEADEKPNLSAVKKFLANEKTFYNTVKTVLEMYSGDQDISKIQKVLAKRRAKSLREQEEYNFEQLMDIVRNQRQDAQRVINKMTAGKSGDTGLEEDINSLQNYFDAYENLFNKYQQARKQPGAEKAELVVTTKKGEVIPVTKEDQEKVVQIFELIQDWITIYKFIITEFAKDIKQLGGDVKQQLSQINQNLLTADIQKLLPPPEKLLPVPVQQSQTTTQPAQAPAEEETEELDEEDIQLEESAINGYTDALKPFLGNFMKTKTLHKQSEYFRIFYDSIYPIAGIPTDKIVGDQISAYTQTARPDLNITDRDIQNEQEEQKPQIDKQLSKNIASGANVIERHSQAILEILEGYEKYLNIGSKEKGGVEQGSRILFNKFGESNPKKLLYKFVSLIVKDINESYDDCEEMIRQIDQVFSDKEPQNESLLKEDLSVRNLSPKEKIILVIKTFNEIKPLAIELRDKITKRKQDKLSEAPTAADDARINPNPTGTDRGPDDGEERTSRKGNEIQEGYRSVAKKIFDLLTKIRPLFPTSQPFDTDYGFSAALKAFKDALKGLTSQVAKIQKFDYDQLTNKATLRSFMEKITAFKRVIKEIFGFTDDIKSARKQAAFNKIGQESGLDFKEDYDGEKAPASKEEIIKLLRKTLKDYEPTQYLLRMIMTTSSSEKDPDENAKMFEPIQSSRDGIITKPLTSIRTNNQKQSSTLDIEEKKIEDEIQKSSKGNFSSSLQRLKNTIVSWLKRIVNSGGILTITEEENISEKVKIRQVGERMISMISAYYLMKGALQGLEIDQDIKEQDIKQINKIVNDYTIKGKLISTIVRRYKIEPELSPSSSSFYGNFHTYKIPGFMPTGTKAKEDPESEKPKSPQEKKIQQAAEEVSDKVKKEVSDDENVSSEDIKMLVDKEYDNVAKDDQFAVVLRNMDKEEQEEIKKQAAEKVSAEVNPPEAEEAGEESEKEEPTKPEDDENFKNAIDSLKESIEEKGGAYVADIILKFGRFSTRIKNAKHAEEFKSVMMDYINSKNLEQLYWDYRDYLPKKADEFTIDDLADLYDEKEVKDQFGEGEIYSIARAASNIRKQLPEKEEENIEEQISNKLKPLIKEMLRRN